MATLEKEAKAATSTRSVAPNFWTLLSWGTALIISIFACPVFPVHHYKQCKGRKVLNASYGIITDGHGKYPMETHCEWLIDAQSKNKSITLVFHKLITECSYDILFIYDGNSYNSTLLGSFSGDIIPEPVTAFSGYMLIHLYSDNNHALDGFNATYSITDCPYNCSKQGECRNHTCACNFWFTGKGCEKRSCSIDSCNGHGKCHASRDHCVCDDGYVGANCDLLLKNDSGQGQWYILSKSSNIFTPRTGHVGIFIEKSNNLWIFGGFTLNTIIDDLIYYSFDTSLWESVPKTSPWPVARYGHAGAEFEDCLYIYGGIIANKIYSNELWEFNTTSFQWLLKSSNNHNAPPSLTSHTLTRVNDWLYLFGGLLMNGLFSSNMYRVNITSGIWEHIKTRGGRTFMRRLAGHTTVFHPESNSLLVFGGFWMESASASERTNSLHAFHLKERYWSKMAHPYTQSKHRPRVIAHHSAVLMGNYLVIFGGNSHVHNDWKICYDGELYLYNIGCHTWVSHEALEQQVSSKTGEFSTSKMPKVGRFGHSSAVAYRNILLIAGGYAGRVLGDLVAYKVPSLIASSHTELDMDYCEGIETESLCLANPECLMCVLKDTTSLGCVHYNNRKKHCLDSDPIHQCGGVCELLQSCGDCLIQGQRPVLFNSSSRNVVHNEECLWCVKEDKCQRKSEPQNTCRIANGTKSGLIGWWAGLSAALTKVSQCRAEDRPAGLHWIKYQNPLNTTYPDQAEIIRETVSRLKFESTLAKDVDQNGFYIAHYTGFIYPLQFPPPNDNKSLVLTVGTSSAKITLYLSKDKYKKNKEKVTGSGDQSEKSVAYKARRFGDSMLFTNKSRGAKYYIDLEAQLNITTSQNSVTEFKSTIDITWNNIRHKKNNLRQKNEVDEQALTYEFLQPYSEGNCHQHYNCLGCLSDNACGWCVESSSCVLRDENSTELIGDKFSGKQSKDKCKGDMDHHLLITNIAECPICSDYVSCLDCSSDVLCEWVIDDAHCIRRGRVEEAVKHPKNCSVPCHDRTSCFDCTSKRDECAWCENTHQCLTFAQYVPLHMYGQCQHWVYSKLPNIQCHNCSIHLNYSDCLHNFGCGWCFNEYNPTIGVCLDGDFVGPASGKVCAAVISENHNVSELETAHWAYGVVPEVNECTLGLHKCHPNATCFNTLDSYTCKCKRGFVAVNGTKQCKKTCYYNCVHGKCSNSPDYLCQCDIGWTGADCNTSCDCNGHSACPKGIGICEECHHNTMGQYCELCQPGSYGDPTSGQACKPCECNGHGDDALGECHNQTGKCFCKDDTKGFHCQHCLKDYYGNPRNNNKCYRRCGAATVLTNVTSGALGSFETTPELSHGWKIYCLWIITPYNDVQKPFELAREKKTLPSISLTFEPDISVNCSLDDFIYVYDGIPDFVNGSSRNNGLLLGTFCGKQNRPLSVEAVKGVLTVYFVSYEKGDPIRQGFNAHFMVNWCPSYCNGNRECKKDQCVCKEGYVGPTCEQRLCFANCTKIKGQPECRNCVCPDGTRCYEEKSLVEYLFNPTSRDEQIYPPHLARMGHSLISCGDDVLYLYGGRSLKYGLINEMWMFNLSSREWSKVIASTDEEPAGRYYHAAVCVPIIKTIFIYGGIIETGRKVQKYKVTNEFWKFAVESRKWKKERSDSWLPAVAGHTLTYVLDTKLVVIGGFSTENYFLDKVLIYNSAQAQWDIYHRKNLSGVIPLGIYGHSAVYHLAVATIYIYGGMLFTKYYKFHPSKELYTFDVDKLQWNILQASDERMLQPRMFHVAVNTRNYMLLIGGRTVDRTPIKDILLYRFKCNTWQNISFKDPEMNDYLRNYFGAAAATTVDSYFYIMGGYNGVESGKLVKIKLPADTCSLIYDYETCKSTVGCSACKVEAFYNLTYCISTEGTFPDICFGGNISEGKICDHKWFEGRNCNKYKTCDQCLAIYPEFKKISQVCKWCKHCKVGKCIHQKQECGAQNPCNRSQAEFLDMSDCDGIVCKAVNCHSCHNSKNCMWTRQVTRTGEITRMFSGNPRYSWSCVIAGVQQKSPKGIIMGSRSFKQHSSECPSECYQNKTCEKCVSSHGAEGGSQHCVWSEKLHECIPPAYIPLHCSSGECGSLLREYNHCPIRCMEIQQCSRCISSPGCGWCSFGDQLDGRGLCMPGGLSGTSNGLCSESNITYGSTHLSEKIQDKFPDKDLKISWVFVKCPPEDECKNSHHTCDATTEKCVDTPDSFKCICKPGYKKRDQICEPVCTQGCVHGICTSPNQCKCNFGWVGSNCSVECSCNSHSECENEKSTSHCLDCLHNTQGPQCQRCKPLFVGDPRNGGACMSCFDYCNNHTKICKEVKERENDKFVGMSRENQAVCENCQNNTEGKHCERCKKGFFRLAEEKLHNLCRPCMCNGHAFDCDENSGTRCICKNNTMTKCDKDKGEDCYKNQCSSCQNNYLGEPTDGHQCYSQMNVDVDYCFDPEDHNACGINNNPLLKGRTVFYAVQPKYLNVNIRITIDVTQGGVDVYFSPDDKTFVVDLNRKTWFHEVKLDKSLKLQGIYRDYIQYARNDVHYYLRKEVARDTNKFLTLEQANTTLNVSDVRFRLVITLPLDVHDLEKSQFYIIIYGRGDVNSNVTYGKLFFRQDQPHIDLFVFFSVFFSCFFLFLAICVLIWKIKQTVDAQRSRQQRAREMQHMASRPFAGVLVLVDHDAVLSNPTPRKLRVNKPSARSPQCPEVNLMHQCLREDHFSISPIAIEPTEDGIASVATVVFQLPGGGSTASKVCLGSALTMRMCPATANLRMTMRRRPSSSLA